MGNLFEKDTCHSNVNISNESYLLSNDEDMIKRLRFTSVNKYNLDKLFMYTVKNFGFS